MGATAIPVGGNASPLGETAPAPTGDAPATAGGRRANLLALAPGVAAIGLWAWSLSQVDVRDLGEYGLPPGLPVTWYLALAITIATALILLLGPNRRPMVALGYVALIAVVLYGTVPALSAQPHYAWVYKHLGVVRYLERTGEAHRNVDIYNRWPGFFALAAAISKLGGRTNPESYAAWADLFFMLINTMIVTVAVKLVTRELRIAVAAAMLFVLSNWVGQTYYSPQAFAYTLSLALVVILLGQLRANTDDRPTALVRGAQRIARRPQLTPDLQGPRWPKASAIAAVLAIDGVIVASHQLTPYVVLVGTAGLMLIGAVRPRWPLVVMGAMTLGYLAINLRFVEHNYGLFSSIDPFNNVQGPKVAANPSPGKVLNADTELLFIAIVWLCTLAAFVSLYRRGLALRALPLAVLAIAPVAIVFGQNYGGEASLRVVLFSSPWCSALIAWAALEARPWRARALMTALALGFTPLFLISYLGLEELNIVSPAEVAAAETFYAKARHGAVLVLAAPGFPYRYGGTYPDYAGPEGDANPNLMTERAFVGHELGPAQVRGIAGRIREYSTFGYIAFTRDETAYAEVFRLTPKGAMENLRAAVAASASFRLWYANKDVQIYELANPAPRSPSAGAATTRTLRSAPTHHGAAARGPGSARARTSATTRPNHLTRTHGVAAARSQSSPAETIRARRRPQHIRRSENSSGAGFGQVTTGQLESSRVIMPAPVKEIAARSSVSSPAAEKASFSAVDAGALLRGARSLVANTAITSSLGLAFWVLAARLFSRETVGRDSVLLSVMVELSAICQLDMQSAILRFLPDLGGLSRAGLVCAYGLSGVLALVAGTVFVLVAPDVAGNLEFLRASPGLAVAFVGVLVLWGAFVLQDAALTAVRRAKFVAIENGTFGVLKLGALAVLAAAGSANGVFLAWVLPVAPLIVAVNVYLFGWGIPAHAEEHGAKDIGTTLLGKVGLRGATRFLAGDYIASVLGQASVTMLPLLAIAILGASESAYLAIPLGVALAFDTLASGAGGALVVESTLQREKQASLARLFVYRVGGPLFAGALVVALAAPIVLLPFGGGYAAHGASVLRLLIGASALRVVLSTFVAEARARGKVGRLVVMQLLIFVGVVASAIPLADAYGVQGLAAAWLAGNLLGCVYAVPIIVKNLRG